MSRAAENLQRRFGQNLSESLGMRSQPSAPTAPPADQFHGESDREAGRSRARNAGHMEIDRIVPDPDQPRKDFTVEAIERLAASIAKHGQLMPVRVRWKFELGKWVIVSGERRYRAALQAGLKTLACIFVEGEPSPAEVLQEQIIENLLREDLKPVEQAGAYRQLMQLHGWTAKQLSEELHVSQATVSRALSLLELPAELQKQVDSGAVPASAAYELAKVQDAAEQAQLAAQVVSGGLTRDDAVEAVRRRRGSRKTKTRRSARRVVRIPAGRVTVELRKAGDADAIRAALFAALEVLDSERQTGANHAA